MIDHRDILRTCVHACYVGIVFELVGWFVGWGAVTGPIGLGAFVALTWVMWSTVRLMGRK